MKLGVALFSFLLLDALLVIPQTETASVDDLIFRYRDQNVSFVHLRTILNVTAYWSPSTCQTQMRPGYSCEGRCRARSYYRGLTEKSCYCDSICMEMGDCCYDYVKTCSPETQWHFQISNPKRSCIDINKDAKGYILVSGCPSGYSNTGVISKCSSTANRSDVISGIPVYDMRTNVSYKNAYCASCNGAKNVTYWRLSITCNDVSGVTANTSIAELMRYVKAKCNWKYEPNEHQKAQLNYCKLQDNECSVVVSSFTSPLALTSALCALYSLPYGYQYRRNPHCALCRGEEVLGCLAPGRGPPPPPIPPPPLSILFDVQTGTSYKVSLSGVVQRETTGRIKCNQNQVFDPFSLKCNDLPRQVQLKATKTHSNANNTKGLFLGENCTIAMFNVSRALFSTNGGIIVRYKGFSYLYTNGSYLVSGSAVYLCLRPSPATPQEPHAISWLQIVSYTGSALSILAEVVLLVMYMMLRELRNLPGKILMSLVFCLLVYQVFFLMAGLREVSGFCVAVAVIVHYFLLAAFAWMSVMAYDVMKTFGSHAALLVSNSRATFVKYCCVGYSVPAVIVIVSITLDRTGAVEYGYGKGQYCWIAASIPLIATLHVPVAMVILFNIVALTWTMIGIRRTNKMTNLARPTSRCSTARHDALLCVKLSTVMGFPWILGLLAGFISSPYLLYPHVILNSLQGFFICMAFTTNQRTLGLLRGKFGQRRGKHSTSTQSATQQTRI